MWYYVKGFFVVQVDDINTVSGVENSSPCFENLSSSKFVRQGVFKLAVTVHRCLKAAHHRTCRTTAPLSPVLTLGAICIPPTINYLQYLATDSTLMAVRLFQLPVPQSGTLSRISSGT